MINVPIILGIWANLVSNWWCCLSLRRLALLGEVGFESWRTCAISNLFPLPCACHSRCEPPAFAPTAMPACLPFAMPPCGDGDGLYPADTIISPNNPFLLEAALVSVLYHSNAEVTKTVSTTFSFYKLSKVGVCVSTERASAGAHLSCSVITQGGNFRFAVSPYANHKLAFVLQPWHQVSSKYAGNFRCMIIIVKQASKHTNKQNLFSKAWGKEMARGLTALVA